MTDGTQLLYLFSSNIRPLYEQDILDLIAAPDDYVYQFRYEDKWINQAARDAWGDLKGTTVLVHFSLQQPARYHDPALIPVRLGSVVETQIVGNVYVVRFKLGAYCTLAEPNGSDLAGPVKKYWMDLGNHDIDRPYDFVASIDKDVRDETGLEAASDEKSTAAIFQRITKYLHKTQSFASARFVRFAELRELSGDAVAYDVTDRVFKLTPGHTYEVDFFHSQPGDITGRDSFHVSADKTVVGFTGRSGFDVASRYDVTTVSFHARTESDTLVVVSPEEGVRGPIIRLPLRIRLPPGTRGAAAGMVVAGSSLVAAASFTAGWWKPAFLLTGTIINALVAVFGLRGAK